MSFPLKAQQEFVRSFDSGHVALNRLVKMIILDGALGGHRSITFCPSILSRHTMYYLDGNEQKLYADLHASYKDYHELLTQLYYYSISLQPSSFAIKLHQNSLVWSITFTFDHTSPALFGDLINFAEKTCSRRQTKQTALATAQP